MSEDFTTGDPHRNYGSNIQRVLEFRMRQALVTADLDAAVTVGPAPDGTGLVLQVERGDVDRVIEALTRGAT